MKQLIFTTICEEGIINPIVLRKKNKGSGRLSKLFPGMDPESGKAWLQTHWKFVMVTEHFDFTKIRGLLC